MFNEQKLITETIALRLFYNRTAESYIAVATK